MLKRLINLLAPFSVIARELTIIRELYEAELLTRNPPIWRVTETPGPSDTEVAYGSDPPPRPKSDEAFEALVRSGEDDFESGA